MTFREISLQMLRKSYKRYLLYFYCNVFTAAIFYTFASIYTNEDFMNPSIVNPMISSNIIAPSVFTVIFMFFFIPYSYSVFFRNRKSEYGILMTLGMTEKEVLTNMLAENLLINLLSLVAGILAGTLISLLFFWGIRNVIGISGVAWKLSLKPYAITAGVYLAITAVTLALQLFGFVKMQITDMLKARSRGEKEVKPSLFGLIAGSLLSIASVAVMLTWFRAEASWVLLISFVLMMAGIWLLLGCMRAALTGRAGAFDLGSTFVRQHFRSYRTVTFITVSLFATSVFLAGLSMVTYPDFQNNALNYSPYDLVHVQSDGKNEMTLQKASELLLKHGVSVVSSAEMPYMRNGVFNLFSVSEINRLTGLNYAVKPGEYLLIYQYDLNDGYSHEMNLLQTTIDFSLGTEQLGLKYAGQDVRILFNNNSGFADKTLLLADADYKEIEKNGEEYYSGIIKCFIFSDWRNSGQGLQALQQVLTAQNHPADAAEEKYFKISSKLKAYSTAQQSSCFLIFVMSFVVALFYLSANIIIYFKIQGEAEDEKQMYRGIYRIGISGEEMHGILKHKNKLYCLIPLYAGSAVGVFFSFATNALSNSGLSGIIFAVAVSALLLLLQGLVLASFTRWEEKALGVEKWL
jgi:hypothetical protein